MAEERRRSLRANARLTTIITNLSTKKAWRALTKDVGGAGVCVATDEPLKPGMRLKLEIKLPDRETPITFQGEVVWSQAVGGPRKSYEPISREVGVKFVEIDPQHQALLRQYVMMNAPPPKSS